MTTTRANCGCTFTFIGSTFMGREKTCKKHQPKIVVDFPACVEDIPTRTLPVISNQAVQLSQAVFYMDALDTRLINATNAVLTGSSDGALLALEEARSVLQRVRERLGVGQDKASGC